MCNSSSSFVFVPSYLCWFYLFSLLVILLQVKNVINLKWRDRIIGFVICLVVAIVLAALVSNTVEPPIYTVVYIHVHD